VIKANAYGHGVLPVAQALLGSTDGYALIELEAALALREAGITRPILMLEGPYCADDLALFAELELTPVLHALWQIDALIKARLPRRLPVYLKLNTGMNRLGLNVDELELALAKLDAADCVAAITLMTHFADADEERGIADQLARFQAMAAGRRLAVSLANSAALLRFPAAINAVIGPDIEQWLRPGIMLYGASPFPARQSAAELGLRPVMTLKSELIAVRELQVGDTVGYGGSFVAERAMRVGIVACGYADGYPRHAPTGTPVRVAGVRTQTLGRVSMDKICVDLTPLAASVTIGAAVILWGGDETASVAADDVATAAGTVAYELFCALAGRVPVIESD